MMSIRLRFTLLYTSILAVTIATFGFVLYALQARSTLDSLQQDLRLSANILADATLRSDSLPEFPKPEDFLRPWPIPFDEFSPEQEFQSFPEREISRILDADGNLISSPFGRQGDALPLSAEGLQTLQNKQEWWEIEAMDGEELLIYSRPIIVNDELVYIVQTARPLTERDRSLQSLVTTLLIASSIVVLIAFGIGWFLSGITLQPIHRITQTAQKIGDESDFTRRVDYTGPPDDVGHLANTFNSMLSRLQDAFQKVEHTLQMQREFVADVSHELRTPLTTLRGNLGLLRRDPPPEEQADILNDMVDENDRLIRLVNDLLLLARADAGRSLAKEPIDLSALLEETIRQARQLDSKRNINLDAFPDLNILGDRDAVKQVLLITLDNALKHSAGDVDVTAEQKSTQVEIRVQDFGEGIPPEKLEHVFDRFYRGDEAFTIPGFGLGLAIAKSLVDAQGGMIKMESEVGRGSILVLQFQRYPPS